MEKRNFGLLVLFAVTLFFANPCHAAYRLDKADLCREMGAAGYEVIGDAEYYGVPCVRIVLPENQAIYQVCRRTPILDAYYLEAREAIAVVNGLNMFYYRGQRGKSNETVRETILIPLDTTVQPRIFPEFDKNYSRYGKMVFVDRGKQLMAYYESGRLIACFPVSTGRPGKGTPAMEGWISFRDKDHVSSIYDVLMPFSLHLAGPYYLHAGVMPGQADSSGCIRMFTENARWLFGRVGKDKVRFTVD